jgi:predicted RNA binding protein YcfA (HicA-like mRNA interferase family)
VSKSKKRLEKLKQNPKNVSFDDLRLVLEDFGFELKGVVGSHHTFSITIDNETQILTVPFRRPVKTIYVKKALQLIELIEAQEDEDNDEPTEDD